MLADPPVVVQSLCECWLVLLCPTVGELAWREVYVGRVGSVQVVVDSPVLDDHLGLEQAVELPAVQRLITKPSVERLDPGVLVKSLEKTPISHIDLSR